MLNQAQNVHTTCDGPLSTGNAVATLKNTTFCLYLSYTGLSLPELFSHIHGPAAIGADAGILFTLSLTRTKRDCFTFNSTQVGWLNDGLLYVNIHSNTTGCTAGEIRGQILTSELGSD